MRIIAYIALTALLCGPIAASQSIDPERLNDISTQQAEESAKEAELRKSREKVQGEIDVLRKGLVKIGTEVADIEKQDRLLTAQLNELELKRQSLTATLTEDQQILRRLLGIIQRAKANPPPALLLTPEDAATAVRTTKLSANISAELAARSEKLKVDIESLNSVEADIATQKHIVTKNRAALSERQALVRSKVSEKSRLEASIGRDHDAAQKRVAALAAEANDLRDLISRFESSTRDVIPRIKPPKSEASRPNPTPNRVRPRTAAPSTPLSLPHGTKKFADAKGQVLAPVSGTVSKSYTKARKGMTVTAHSKAQVVAPHAGRIEFAGDFKNYDKVIILNMDDGYFLLLTGLGETFAKTGTIVAPGEPLGLMPFNTNGATKLYIELRKDGTPINPSPWLGTAFARTG